MLKTEKTKDAEHIFYLKQTLRMVKKEHKRMCKDKDFVFGCISCQARRFTRDFEAYIDWLQGIYKWSYGNKPTK